ncbi:MAG: RES domain-containing protein [Defluviicoccus sp.]|nr:RES domain-containing protein [Defluviicoccus sp.]MDE0383679.1 RES domain-containing protein [Defluviicoccus sp.]
MRLRATAYRAHNPQWAWTPLSGEGARRHGGRFNRRGVPALYTSLSPLTAIREAQPLGRPMQPLILCAYAVDAEPVFDALDAESRREIGVAASELACPTWEADMLAGRVAASQALADRLIAAGFAGMRVRSFAAGTAPDDLNLVLWRWGDDRPARIALIDDEGRLRPM